MFVRPMSEPSRKYRAAEVNSYRSIDARLEALEASILEVEEDILSSRAGGDTVGERWSPFERYS